MKIRTPVTTPRSNILDLIVCSIDYGFYDDVLMDAFREMLTWVDDEEIAEYCTLTEEHKKQGYAEEDMEVWGERLEGFRDRYMKN